MCSIFHRISMVAGFAVIFFLYGCDDPNYVPDTFTNVINTDPTMVFSYPDVNGMMVVMQSFTLNQEGYWVTDPKKNKALAYFPSSSGTTPYLDAGEVTVNGQMLLQQPDLSYFLEDSVTPLDFSDGIIWDIAGSAYVQSNGDTLLDPLPTFEQNQDLPSFIRRLSGSTLVFGSGAFKNATSVLVSVHSGEKYAIQTIPSNAGACSFSSAELFQLPSTPEGMIQIMIRYREIKLLDNNRRLYFINQVTYIKPKVELW